MVFVLKLPVMTSLWTLDNHNNTNDENSTEEYSWLCKQGITKGQKRVLQSIKATFEKVEKMNTIAAEMGPGFQVFCQKVFNCLTSKNDSHLEN